MVVDIETSGLKPFSIEILHAAFIACDNDLNVIERRMFKIRPRIWDASASQAVAIHGIERDVAYTYPPYNDVMKEMFEWLTGFGRDNILAMHVNQTSGTSYDGATLRSHALYNDYYFEFGQAFPESKYVSTHTMAKQVGINGGLSLDELCKYFSITDLKHHDAESDCNATYNIIKQFKERYSLDVFTFLQNKQEVKNAPTNRIGKKTTKGTVQTRGQLIY